MMNFGPVEMLLMSPFMILGLINQFLPFITLVLAILIINSQRRLETKLDFLMRHQPTRAPSRPDHPYQQPGDPS